ncbi:MAG: hemolysin III family protein [Opitutales bacterium]|nr:hemolysin III family protein [Opitutales bacterium]
MSQEAKVPYTVGEEIFNAVSHGIGVLLGIGGTAVLIVLSAIYSDAWGIVSASIYGASLIILYLMSTFYHAFTCRGAKKFFKIMDHNTIFLLIAGTYTPFTLVSLNGPLGWTLFGIVWAMAIIGIVLNSIDLEKYKKISLVCYIVMGWAVIFAVKPVYEALSLTALVFLALGGVFYTVGIVFYVLKKVKWFHSIWHLFTVAGSVFQYFAVLLAIVGD